MRCRHSGGQVGLRGASGFKDHHAGGFLVLAPDVSHLRPNK